MAIEKSHVLQNSAQGNYWRIQEIQFNTIEYDIKFIFALFVSQIARNNNPSNPLDWILYKVPFSVLNLDLNELMQTNLDTLKGLLYNYLKTNGNNLGIDFSVSVDV